MSKIKNIIFDHRF